MLSRAPKSASRCSRCDRHSEERRCKDQFGRQTHPSPSPPCLAIVDKLRSLQSLSPQKWIRQLRRESQSGERSRTRRRAHAFESRKVEAWYGRFHSSLSALVHSSGYCPNRDSPGPLAHLDATIRIVAYIHDDATFQEKIFEAFLAVNKYFIAKRFLRRHCEGLVIDDVSHHIKFWIFFRDQAHRFAVFQAVRFSNADRVGILPLGLHETGRRIDVGSISAFCVQQPL